MDAARADGGLSLLQWQRRFPDGKVPLEQAFSAIRQLTAALHQVHIERPCHRDIIPSTIVVHENPDGSASFEVPDLGAALESHGEIGARRYLAPEQWWGARQNTATDQYALAVLFVELVTGTVPFVAAFDTEDETVMRTAVCDHPPKLPEDCPKREVLLRALAKDPRRRFHSCSSFVRALLAEPAEQAAVEAEESRAHPHHVESRRPRRRLQKMKIAFLLVLLGAGVYWGVRSGFFERLDLDGSRATAQAKQLAALRQHQAQQIKATEQARRAKLAGIQAELKRQEVVAAQALTNLQVFLESGGAAVLSVRQESLNLARQKARAELAVFEKEVAADRALEQALAALRTRTVPYGSVAKDIPTESEVAVAYRELVAAAAKQKELDGKFTEKHPQVTAQKAAVKAALKRFFDAVDGSLAQARASLAAREGRLNELRNKAADAQQKFETVARELQVAQLKQEELERARARESDRLAELRRRAFDVQFGSGDSVTNAASVR